MSNYSSKLTKYEQQVARLEKSLAIQRFRDRKADTRYKIQLGGLVIKSGLHILSKAEILGLLIEAKEKLSEEENFESLQNWARIGDREFREANS